MLKEDEKQKNNRFSDELKQLVEAGKNGNFDFMLNYNGLSDEEKQNILLVNEAIRKYGAAREYDLMKYKLTSDALGIALWDMDVISADPINPDNKFTWSQEFRVMLGFNNESDFPNVTHSWSDRLHPEDKKRTLDAFSSHINDYTGKTPYNIEYRLMLKNGCYRYFHAFGTTLRDKNGIPLRVAGALMDIDDKIQMQNQLMIMSSIVHNSPNFISYKKLGGKCLYVNPAASVLTGYSHDELMDNYIDSLFGNKADEYSAEVTNNLIENGLAQYVYKGKVKNGELRTISGTSFMIEKDTYATIALDVTEAKKMEESLRLTHERLMLMLDTSPLCTQIWDKNFNTIDCNEAAIKLYGFKNKQEYIGNFLKRCSPEYQPDGQRSVEKIVKLVSQAFEEGNCRFDWMNKMPDDDTPIPSEIILVRAEYESNDVVIGYTRDMREYHKLLQTINALTLDPLNYNIDSFDDNLLKAMNAVGTAVYFDNVHIWKNKEEKECSKANADKTFGTDELRYAKLYEWSSSFRLQKGDESIDPVLFNTGWYEKLSANQCISGNVKKFPAAERKLLQSQNIISIIVVPVFLYNKFWGFVSFCDCRNDRNFSMSEEAILRTISFLFANSVLRNEMTVRLTNATEEALAASKAKSTFLASMSHEIRTPMNAILGMTDILMLQKGLSEETEAGLEQIHNSCDLLLGIINDILDFSKIEAGKMDIIPAQYMVESLINDSVNLNMMRIEGKPIEFDLHIDENIPSKLTGDALRIKQILNNLLSNAFKYTEAGEVSLSISCETESQVPQTSKENVTLVFNLKDTGRGMTGEQLSRLFDEYSRFSVDTSTIEGTGLGLAITKHLIRLMNGTIHVKSKPGVGSLFVFRLPQKIVDSEVIGKKIAENLKQFKNNFSANMNLQRNLQPMQQNLPPMQSGLQPLQKNIQHRSQITRDPMPYGKVLIVDDVETNILVAMGLLKPYMLQIDTVMCGRDAIDRVKSGKMYDIVFMDHMMPEMDGIETVKHIRQWEEEQKSKGSESEENEQSGSSINKRKRTPIIALTANAVVGQSDLFLQNGFDDFISKPIDIRQLNFILNKYIRDKQPPHVIEAAYKQAGGQNSVQEKGTESLNTNNDGAQQNVDSLLLESFLRDAKKAAILLTRLYQNEDWFENEEDLRRFIVCVHGMKSSLSNIGEAKLSEFAYKMEISGREKNTFFIKENSQKFLNELRILLYNKEKECKEDDYTDEDSDILSEDLNKKLTAIIEMCSDYNRKGVLDLIAATDIRSKTAKAIFDKVKEHVIHSEFEDAENAVKVFMDKAK